jgi:outer membrane protein OmpA-like peptidoglycan-associated protein
MGSAVGESPSTMTRATTAGVPMLLGAVAQRGSTEVGARGLMDAIHSGGYDTADPSTFGSMIDREDSRRGFLERGQGMLSSVFGDGLGSAVGGFGSKLGLSSRSSTGILAMLAPIVMSVLGKHVREGNLTPAGLSTLLRSQTPYITSATSAHGAREVAIAGKHRRGGSSWLWALGLGAIAIAGAFFLCNREKPSVSTVVPAAPNLETPNLNLPEKPSMPTIAPPAVGGGPPAAPAMPAPEAPKVETPKVETPTVEAPKAEMGQGIDALASYLDGKGDNNRFMIEGSKFATASSTLSAEARQNYDRLADLLKSHPNAHVKVEGFTDSVGPASENQPLSVSRAESVKKELTSRGIDAGRIETGGYAADRPIASNDDARGRAMNRRAEIVVTK